MDKIQEYKKRVYGVFSDSFFLRKRQVEIVAENAYKVKRPYKGYSKQLATYSKGVESIYAIFIGFGSCIWFASGAFLSSKNAAYNIPICIFLNIFTNFCCDFIKVKVIFPYYEDTIKGVLSIYPFEEIKVDNIKN